MAVAAVWPAAADRQQTAGRRRQALDLGVVSTVFITNHPDAVDAWRKAEAQALTTIKNDPTTTNAAIAAELGISADEAAAQVKQAVYLTPTEITSATWLGTDGTPGNVAVDLHDAAVFLHGQKQTPAVPDQSVFDKAIFTKGLPGVLTQS